MFTVKKHELGTVQQLLLLEFTVIYKWNNMLLLLNMFLLYTIIKIFLFYRN